MGRPATPAKADEWRLTTIDFARLWSEQGGLEFPTQFVPSRPAPPENDVVDRPARKRPGLGTEQRRALAAFTRPRNSVTVLGVDASRAFSDPGHHVRMVAAWSGPEYAYLARQSPGAAIGTAGTIAITRHRVAEIVRAITGYLPTATATGRLPRDAQVRFTDHPIAGNDVAQVVAADRETATAANAFGANVNVSHCGSISINAGSITEGYPPTTIEARYRDVIGDGRYVLLLDRPGFATGVDEKDMVRVLNSAVNVNRRRHEARLAERDEDGW